MERYKIHRDLIDSFRVTEREASGGAEFRGTDYVAKVDGTGLHLEGGGGRLTAAGKEIEQGGVKRQASASAQARSESEKSKDLRSKIDG